MARPVLHTERLALRPMTPEHLPLLHLLDSDPEVMRHLLGRARTPAEIDAFWGPRCGDTIADAVGLGWWVGFRGDDFVGWWDLSRSDSDPQAPVTLEAAEIGWRVRRLYWRQGLASEGALALLAYGFDTVGVARIWAETKAANVASQGVMRRIGLRRVRTDVPDATDHSVTYELTRAEWIR